MSLVAIVAAVGGCGNPVPPSSQPGSCGGQRLLRGSGSSAQADAVRLFADAYGTACRGYGVQYSSTGSAAGRAAFIKGDTDFAGTDAPLGVDTSEMAAATARCGGREVWNLPVVFGAVALIYNLPETAPLALDASATAKIFGGMITKWDAPEIVALNPGRRLPSERIVVIARDDASGTTDNFQKYLVAAAGAAWSRGAGETFKGVSTRTATGNEGVWAAMRAAPGSIAYTAWPFAKKNGLATADIVAAAGGEPVTLSVDSVSRSLSAVTMTSPGNNVILDPTAAYRPTRRDAYPLLIVSYEAICSHYPDHGTATAVRNFLKSALGEGQSELTGNGFVPVPESIKGRLVSAIAGIE